MLHLATKDVLRLQNEVCNMKLEVKENKRRNTLNFIFKTLEHNFLEYSIFKVNNLILDIIYIVNRRNWILI